METTDIDKIHTIYQRELKEKERQIEELKSLLYHQQGNYKKVRPGTAKSNPKSSMNFNHANLNNVNSQTLKNNAGLSNSESVRDLTSKEIAEIFLQCVTAVKKQDILEKGTEHWTKTEKNEMIYNFITNKRVLQILYDIMAQGKNDQVSQSHVLSNLSTMRSRGCSTADDKNSTVLLHRSKTNRLMNSKLKGNLSSLNPLNNLSEFEEPLNESYVPQR
jgi:hypothetical protein